MNDKLLVNRNHAIEYRARLSKRCKIFITKLPLVKLHRETTIKFENRSLYSAVTLYLVLNNISVSETAIYEVRSRHFVLGVHFSPIELESA